jgi:hypothetical protein
MTIAINSSALSQSNGWVYDSANSNGADGIDYSALNVKEDFVASIAHEMVHAYHLSLFFTAVEKSGAVYGDNATVYNYMLNNLNVDEKIVNLFFNNTNGIITINNNTNVDSHKYMSDPANGVIDSIMQVVNEFREDSRQIQGRMQELQQNIEEMEREGKDPGGGYNEQSYNFIISEYNSLNDQYGWMWE